MNVVLSTIFLSLFEVFGAPSIEVQFRERFVVWLPLSFCILFWIRFQLRWDSSNIHYIFVICAGIKFFAFLQDLISVRLSAVELYSNLYLLFRLTFTNYLSEFEFLRSASNFCCPKQVSCYRYWKILAGAFSRGKCVNGVWNCNLLLL